MPRPSPQAPSRKSSGEEPLRLLAILHFAAALFALALIALLYWQYSRMHAAFLEVTAWKRHRDGGASIEPFLAEFKRYYLIAGAAVAACGAANLLSGIFISQRRCRKISLFIAGLNGVFVPVGSVLGAYTMVVLLRDSTRAAYERRAAGPAAPRAGPGPAGRGTRP
jgi:hypothetical protein